MKLTSAIESAGYGITGNIGGLLRTIYYTPDGRIIRAFPDIREYVKKQDGKVIGQGTRDANLDRGWLLSPPVVPKLFCATCDRWHDTQAEIKACEKAQKGLVKRALANERAQKRLDEQALAKANQEEKDKTAKLESKVAELTALVNKLMEGKNEHGQVLQHTAPRSPHLARQQGTRTAKAGVHQ